MKANVQSVAGRMYYFTFEAKDTTAAPSDETSLIFEAEVWQKIGDQGAEVDLCRIKSCS